MIRALNVGDLRCARDGCGMNLVSQRDRHSLKIVHPYRNDGAQQPGWPGCIDQGRVFRRDLSFAGWWMPRQEFKERFGF